MPDLSYHATFERAIRNERAILTSRGRAMNAGHISADVRHELLWRVRGYMMAQMPAAECDRRYPQ